MKPEAAHGRAFGELIASAPVAGNCVWEMGSAGPSFPVQLPQVPAAPQMFGVQWV